MKLRTKTRQLLLQVAAHCVVLSADSHCVFFHRGCTAEASLHWTSGIQTCFLFLNSRSIDSSSLTIASKLVRLAVVCHGQPWSHLQIVWIIVMCKLSMTSTWTAIVCSGCSPLAATAIDVERKCSIHMVAEPMTTYCWITDFLYLIMNGRRCCLFLAFILSYN